MEMAFREENGSGEKGKFQDTTEKENTQDKGKNLRKWKRRAGAEICKGNQDAIRGNFKTSDKRRLEGESEERIREKKKQYKPYFGANEGISGEAKFLPRRTP